MSPNIQKFEREEKLKILFKIIKLKKKETFFDNKEERHQGTNDKSSAKKYNSWW